MRLSLSITNYSWPSGPATLGAELARVAGAADEAGLDTVWVGNSAFHGRHYCPARPINNPPALRKPHPPVLIGGMGERKTLRLVAQYGDACNLFDIPDGGETIRRKLAVLARHRDAVGRPYDEIERTVSTGMDAGEPPGRLAERCANLAALGIEQASSSPPAPGPRTPSHASTRHASGFTREERRHHRARPAADHPRRASRGARAHSRRARPRGRLRTRR